MEYKEKYDILDAILWDRKELFDSYISYENFLDGLISSDNVTKYLGVTDYRMTQLTTRVFPDKGKGKLLIFILALADFKVCRMCDTYMPKEHFRFNAHNNDGLNSHCRSCHMEATTETQAYRQAKYYASKDQRTPPWANIEKIKEFYANCPPGFHVDHIHPLNGKLISGLHVENNLQYLPALENIKKSNKFSE